MSAPDNFILTESNYDSFVVGIDGQNEFKVWQGLVGAHYTPYVDGVGNLSWTNNGGLPNPPTVNISGKGLTITGIVATSGDLPATADQFATYLVGTVEPYSVYMYNNGTWVNIGEMGKGEQGDPGFSPVVTVSQITGGHQISITDAEDTETFNVMDGQEGVGVPTGGTAGQVLAKASGADYDTEWKTPDPGVNPATSAPLMDGTAAAGSSAKYAREDHVHPLYNQFVRPNLLDNWYFVGGGSQQGGGQFPINSNGKTSYSGSAHYFDRWRAWDGGTSATINSANVTLSTGANSDGLYQYADVIEKFQNKTITVSALINGQLFSATGTTTSTAWIAANIDGDGSYIAFILSASEAQTTIRLAANKTATVTAIKLELGDTQTLAHEVNGAWVLNELPNFEEQLLRCKTDAYRVIHPNLLDNWYFVGGGSQQGGGQLPINQRGQTVWIGGEGYAIDEWKTDRYRTGTKSITMYADSLTLANSDQTDDAYVEVSQTNEVHIPNGTLVTMTALVGNNLYSFSGIVNSGYTGQHWDNFHMFFRNTSDGKLNVIARLYYGSSAAIKALKLELGDTQTLAHQENGQWVLNEITNYQTELAKCQRYFQTFRTQSLRPTYGADFRPVMATATPTLDTLIIDGITYYTALSEL